MEPSPKAPELRVRERHNPQIERTDTLEQETLLMWSKQTRAKTPSFISQSGKLKTTGLAPKFLSTSESICRVLHDKELPHLCLCQYRLARLPLNKAVCHPEACLLLPSLFFTPFGNPVICLFFFSIYQSRLQGKTLAQFII